MRLMPLVLLVLFAAPLTTTAAPLATAAPAATPSAASPPAAAASPSPAAVASSPPAAVASPARVAPRWIAARDLQADVDVLRRVFERLHPGLYRYTAKPAMDARFAALRQRFAHGATLPRAYLAFSAFTASIRCGHTYPNPLNQPADVAAAVLQSGGRVPFWFRWVGRRMIVTRSFGQVRLPRGTEVLAIDGTPAAAILARLLTVARADGSNDAKRVDELEVRGDGAYEAFDVYYPLFYPSHASRMTLRVREPGAGATRTLAVRPLAAAERAAPIRAALAATGGGDGALWTFRFLDARTAYLGMPTWAVFDTRWDWRRFLNDALDRAARSRAANLIVDLRGNEGGADVGDVILSRLTTRPLRLAPDRRLVRYRRLPADLRPYLTTWDPSFADWGKAVVPFDARFYRLAKDDDARSVVRPVAPAFRGRVYILVDAANSSATFQFAQLVQQQRLATLVGRPTGGNQRGIDGGAFFFLHLPHARIEIDLPLIGYYPRGARPDAGLRPDLLVAPSIADIAHGVDTDVRALAARLAVP